MKQILNRLRKKVEEIAFNKTNKQASSSTTHLGKQGEKLAIDYLQKQGLRFIEQNYHCRFGEIDLIFQHEDILVFVEVRLRRNRNFGSAAESVTSKKQHRIIKAAQFYSAGKKIANYRFDVMALDSLNSNQLVWIRDAFSA